MPQCGLHRTYLGCLQKKILLDEHRGVHCHNYAASSAILHKLVFRRELHFLNTVVLLRNLQVQKTADNTYGRLSERQSVESTQLTESTQILTRTNFISSDPLAGL